MKKEIKFGNHSATVFVTVQGSAVISINNSLADSLSTLADAINEDPAVNVQSIQRDRNTSRVIVCSEGQTPAELLEYIYTAISEVFNTDIVVCNERAETVVRP